MYKNARNYLAQNNTEQAIITLQQAIKLAPDKMVLYRDLASAYHRSGSHKEAMNILDPILKSNEADDQCYDIYAMSLVSTAENKRAKIMLQDALRKYPNSGLLYHGMGLMYEQEGNKELALTTWLTGIERNAEFHLNYYQAAKMYMNTHKPLWAILYAEMFLNVEQYSAMADETRDMLLGAYMRLFASIGSGAIPKYKDSKNNHAESAGDFEQAVYDTYLKLSPVVSDGINTENLTMLRTRFIMEWYKENAAEYPFGLFARMDDMIRTGYFDSYNQWIFGQLDNPQMFEAWKTFHGDAIPNFEKWLQTHPYTPSKGEFYNKKQVSGIFIVAPADDKGKKKKKD
jgi:tetratricopeptide (TPR) repeat protein